MECIKGDGFTAVETEQSGSVGFTLGFDSFPLVNSCSLGYGVLGSYKRLYTKFVNTLGKIDILSDIL